jgi:hypothetical protein
MLLPLRPPNPEDAEEPHHDAACEGTGMILAAAYTPGEFTARRVDARQVTGRKSDSRTRSPPGSSSSFPGIFFSETGYRGVPVSLIRPVTGIGDTEAAGRRFRGPVPPELRLDLPACRTPTRVANVTSRGCRGPRRPPRGSPPGPSARRAMRRTARTSDRGCHIVASAGIAVPVLQIAPGAQVPECSDAGVAARSSASLAGRSLVPFPMARRSFLSIGVAVATCNVVTNSEETARSLL